MQVLYHCGYDMARGRIALALVVLALAVHGESCRLQFSARWGEGAVEIGTRCTLGLEPPPGSAVSFARMGVRPLVRLAPCLLPVGETFSSITHTLLALAQENNSSEAPPTWTVEIPGFLQNVSCVSVFVARSAIGHIQELRTRLVSEVNVTPSTVLPCSSAGEACEEVDTTAFEGAPSTRLARNGTSYFIERLESGMRIALPSCVLFPGNGTVRWSVVEREVCGESHAPLTLSRVYAVSQNELYLTGSTLLYSPNRGSALYQLLMPGLQNVTAFASSENGIIAFIVISSGTGSLWLGLTGATSLLQLLPSPLPLSLNDHALEGAGLVFENTDLFLELGPELVQLPLPLLAASTSHHITYTPPTPLLQPSLLHSLLGAADGVCPFLHTHVEAPVCGRVTRSRLHVTQEGVALLPETNCSSPGTYLPPELFLDKEGEYNFSIFLTVNPTTTTPSSLLYVPRVNDPEVLTAHVEREFHGGSSSLAFHVVLREHGGFLSQLPSGSILTSLNMETQVWGAATLCLSPFTDHLTLPGWLQTRVHVGCPPGLSLVFDPMASGGLSGQYCSPHNNISCYYFNHVFHPVFRVVDAVTGERAVYTGPYSLQAVAGGTSLSDMRPLQGSGNIEAKIWAPVNGSKRDGVYRHADSGVKWLCGTTSPCGEIVPHRGRTPEYFLLLQASNRGVGGGESYCDFTVEFVVRIHGMGMGAVTVVVTLLCVVVVLCVVVAVLFVLWHWQGRLLYLRDSVKESVAPHMGRAWDWLQTLVEHIHTHNNPPHQRNR